MSAVGGLQMTDADVKKIVKATIKELRRDGLLKDWRAQAYQDIGERLYRYYGGAEDADLQAALDDLRSDYYFRVIPLYYGERWTIEALAEQMHVEVSTITRNKRRLCLAIYDTVE